LYQKNVTRTDRNTIVNYPAINPSVNNPAINPSVNNPAINPSVNNPAINPSVNNPANNQIVYSFPKSVIRDGKLYYYDGDSDKLLAEGWQRYSDEVDIWYCNSITNESSWVPVYLVNV